MKQIEKAFSDLGCFEMHDFSVETVQDLLTYLGYAGDDLAYSDRTILEAYRAMGGTADRYVTKRAFIVFVNAINNVFLQWMKGEVGDHFKVCSEQEAAQIHYRFFALWEHRQKIKISSATQVSRSTALTPDLSFRPQIN